MDANTAYTIAFAILLAAIGGFWRMMILNRDGYKYIAIGIGVLALIGLEGTALNNQVVSDTINAMIPALKPGSETQKLIYAVQDAKSVPGPIQAMLLIAGLSAYLMVVLPSGRK